MAEEKQGNYDLSHNGNYGLPRDLNAKIEYMGFNIFSVLIGTVLPIMISWTANRLIFPLDQLLEWLLFTVLTFAICIYLVLPFNHQIPHWRAFWVFLTNRTHKYFSVDATNLKK